MPVYPPEGADILDNIRYLQDLAGEIDASPALHSGSRRQEKRVNQLRHNAIAPVFCAKAEIQPETRRISAAPA
jgi:hypothetical protein